MTYIVIPTYNEKETIADLVHSILNLGIDAEILIVDANSPDGTGEIADQLAKKFLQVEVLHNPKRLGLGKETLGALNYVYNKGADYVVTMDADFSHKPRYIPIMLNAAQDYDFVIGSRYIEGGKINYPPFRKFLSYSANLFASALLGLRTRECTTAFRCFSKKALQVILNAEIVSEGYVFQTEVIYRIQKAGLTIREVPIIFDDRTRGQSKMSYKEIIGGIKALLRLKLKEFSNR